MHEASFDVVVIGGGSAGCALTRRLCDSTGLRVLLVESGPDYGGHGVGSWPRELLDPRSFPTTHDWGYQEERGAQSAPEPRARVIGGCSTHNQCAINWGHPTDYDHWAEITDDKTWAYDAIRSTIDKIEDARGGDDGCRGRGGLLATAPHAKDHLAKWQYTFLSATQDAGFPSIVDLSSPTQTDGACPFHVNIKGGIRWNAAFAFLDAVRSKPNLKVLSNAQADRLSFEGDRAVSLHCRTGVREVTIHARAFVLCAGVYGSPTILMRSGIGDAAHLEQLGISVLEHRPGIGRNLHDHPGVAVRYEPTAQALASLEQDLAANRFHQSQVALRAEQGGLHVLPYQARLEDGYSFDMIAFWMRPESRGRVLLRSADLDASPVIRFEFLHDRRGSDAAALHRGLLLIDRIARTSVLQPLIAHAPPLPTTNDALDGYIRTNMTGYGHAVGTCRMGRHGDPLAVCSSSGTVIGTGNVFVADASLIPRIPDANTNATSILIGWRTADKVRDALS